MSDTLLRMEEITKVFPGVVANDRVTFEVAPGEVHALLGENGAGKTTLMNILTGLYHPDGGRIFLDGREVSIPSPKAAIRLGIGMVHQHFMLVPPFSVVQNVAMGLRETRSPTLKFDRLAEDIRKLAARFRLDLDPWAVTETLPLGTQQKVEILKALYRKARLLILDEPSAVLTPQEFEELSQILRALVDNGVSIIFISHKLEEVMSVTDRLTVLRGGRVIDTVRTADTSLPELAQMMVGRPVVFEFPKSEREPGETVLELDDVSVQDDKGLTALRGASLKVRRGEILGVAGVDGNGQRELAELIFGLREPASGTVRIEGKDIRGWGPRDLTARSVGRIPEDRQGMGLMLSLTVKENLILERFQEPPFCRRGFLSKRAIEGESRRLIWEHDIRPPSQNLAVGSLSGGNQQKVIIARVMMQPPDLLIAMNPTRGLDVGATEFVYKTLLEQREKGAAILFISSELSEIMSLSDRIVVLYEGRIQGETTGADADELTLGLWMAGVSGEPA
ncbi:MAG: ABC transporter ATP-binding protein [Nitrospinota bacterium]